MATVLPISRIFSRPQEEDRNELIEVGRAVHDAVMAKVPAAVDKSVRDSLALQVGMVEERVGAVAAALVDKAVAAKLEEMSKSHNESLDSLLEPRFKSFESVLAMSAGREIRKSLDERDKAGDEWRIAAKREFDFAVAKAIDPFEVKVKALEGEVSRNKEEAKAAEDEGRTAAAEADGKTFAEVSARIDSLEARIDDLKSTFQDAVAGISEAIKSIPAPQVYVPPDAIKVEQSTPNVEVKIDAPDYQIIVEAMRGTLESLLAGLPPQLDLSVLANGLRDAIAALPPPVLPPPRLVEKIIEYDGMSRPAYTREREIQG